MNKYFLSVCLDLFDGEGAGTEGTTSMGDGSVQDGTATQGSLNTNSQDADGNNQSVSVTSNTLDERKQAYNDFKNQNKDLFSQDMQNIINRRFKETKNLQSKIEKSQPIIDLLCQKYGISNGDTEKLMQEIENDDSYWSQLADDAGMTISQYKEFAKLQRENAVFMKEREERQGQEFAKRQVESWYTQADELKSKFPDFDLTKEIENPEFVSLLKSGTPVEHAYKVMHFDDIMQDTINMTATKTQQAVVNNVRARGMRPKENGTTSQGAFTIKEDVNNLSKEQMIEFAKRASRGEIITFK